MRAGELCQNSVDLRGSHHRNPFGTARPLDVVDLGQIQMEHLPIKKEQCLEEGYVLGRGSYVLVCGKMRQVSADLLYSHLMGMALAVEADKA